MRQVRTGAALAILVAAGWAGGLGVWTLGFRAFSSYSAAVLGPGPLPRPAPVLDLVNHDGQRFSTGDLRGRWLLVTFMYGRCPGVCALAQARVARVREGLGDLVGRRIELLSVSFDGDPPELLHAMWQHHGAPAGWRMAVMADTGQAVLDRLRRFGVLVVPRPDGLYNHGTDLYLLDGAGRLIATFPADRVEATVAAIRATTG